MILRAEQPHVLALTKEGRAWLLPITAADSLRTAWVAGRTFWTGSDQWDSPVTIKLGDIVGVIVKDEHRLALDDAEAEEERVRDMTQGES